MIRALTLSLSAIALAAPMAHAATDGDWWTDPVKGLAFLALLIFFAIVWRAGGFKAMFAAIDKRGADIDARIQEASTLRDQAKKMLADAERQQKRAVEEAQKIVDQAQTDAEAMLAQAEKDLEERITRRKAQADARIARAEAEAVDEVRAAAVDAATRAVRDMLTTSKADTFDAAAAEIEKALS